MDRGDVEEIERRVAYDGHARVEVVRLRHRKHEGGWTGTIQREVIDRGHAVAVLPYDPARDQVVLVEQFRIGPYQAGDAPWLYETVAGLVEDGESEQDVARREALEEAGVAVADLRRVCRYYVSPGILTESVSVYCGRADATTVAGVHGLDHEGEDIRPFAVSLDQALAWIEAERIVFGPAIPALQWLALNRDRLRRDWGGAQR